jgi:exonuclease III
LFASSSVLLFSSHPGRLQAETPLNALCRLTEPPLFNFWDYFRNAFARDAGMRLDPLLLSPAFAPRLAAAGVDRDARGGDKSSDHAPGWVQLRP